MERFIDYLIGGIAGWLTGWVMVDIVRWIF